MLPTGFGKSLIYQILPAVFDFLRDRKGGLHTSKQKTGSVVTGVLSAILSYLKLLLMLSFRKSKVALKWIIPEVLVSRPQGTRGTRPLGTRLILTLQDRTLRTREGSPLLSEARNSTQRDANTRE